MKVSTPVALTLIAAALLIAGIIYYREYQAITDPSEASPEMVVDDSLPFHTEEEWTALQITQYLADLSAFSSKKADHLGTVSIKKTAMTDEGTDYRIKGQSKTANISTKSGIWNPATYTGWAKTILGQPDTANPPTSALDCAQTLLMPSLATFTAENKRISAFLQEHPNSAEGMLEAALLCGTIALNDYSGKFKDTRIPLNRMVAFLAAADALGGPTDSPTRKLAEALRLTLCGQQADALTALSQWPKPEDATLAEWQAILRLRNTMDWREGRAAALAGSPALHYEYFRALIHAIDPLAGGGLSQGSGGQGRHRLLAHRE